MPAVPEHPAREQPTPETLALTQAIPGLPDAILKRFGDQAAQYNEDLQNWWRRNRQLLVESQETFAVPINQATAAVDDLTQQSANAFAAINTEKTARISVDSALASDILTVQAGYIAGDATLAASVTTEATARASADSAEATARTSADASLTTSIGVVSASVVTEATARVAADGAIHAMWGVAINVNGRIVGRINLDATNQSSEFVVQADKFVVENGAGTVTLVDVRASGIVFGADVMSDNFVLGSAGWQIQRNSGSAEFNDVTIRGKLLASKVATDSEFYNIGDVTRTFPATCSSQNLLDNGGAGYTGLGAGAGTNIWFMTFSGWGLGAVGMVTDRFGRSDMRFLVFQSGTGIPSGVGGFIQLRLIYRVNGGATTQVNPFDVSVNTAGPFSLNISGSVLVAGLAATDTVEFGVQAASPNPASNLVVSSLSVVGINI